MVAVLAIGKDASAILDRKWRMQLLASISAVLIRVTVGQLRK